MSDDFRIRLQKLYSVHESAAKRDHHAEGALVPLHNGDRDPGHREHKHDSFELSADGNDGDAADDAAPRKEGAATPKDPPPPAEKPPEIHAEDDEKNPDEPGGLLDVQA